MILQRSGHREKKEKAKVISTNKEEAISREEMKFYGEELKEQDA